MAAVATTVALFGMVTVQSLVGQTQLKTTEIQKRVDAKKDALEALEVEVANLASLDRVATRAAQLGLVVPPATVFLPSPGDQDFDAGALPSFDDAIESSSASASPDPAPRGPARSGAPDPSDQRPASPDSGGR